jgi:Flp pilus assembly protein TadB
MLAVRVAESIFGVALIAAFVTLAVFGGISLFGGTGYTQRREVISQAFPDMPPEAVDFCARSLSDAETARAVWVQYGRLNIK